MQGRDDKAFLNVYLPCLLVLPHYFECHIPHGPSFTVSSAALMPIVVAQFKPGRPWKFRRMDVWVGLFVFSALLSETLRDGKDGFFLWITEFLQMTFVYIVGRQLIEPRLRIETVKRIVFLLTCLTPFIFIEYLLNFNFWLRLTAHLLGEGSVGWFIQLRNGRPRVAACYGDAILAGMVFLTGIALNYFLVQIYKEDKLRLGPWMSKLQRYKLPFFLLPVFLFLTGSRGPMLCALVCYLLMQIPRFKKMWVGATVIILLLGIGGGTIYQYYQAYTSVSDDQVQDEQQGSAIYRRQLIENYTPVVEQGGWLGWGAFNHPVIAAQYSIDNQYLIVAIAQGKFGLYAFYLIVIESVLYMVQLAVRFKSRESLFLVFCMIGAFAGLFFSIKTVYLGELMPELLFLLLGWSQSIQDTGLVGSKAYALPEPKFRFRRVIA